VTDSSCFTKVLIANRGEIAVRVIRACRDAGLASVAIFASDDADAPHVSLADTAIRLDGGAVSETYLNIDAILAAARVAGADAVHPGYGFLSENAGFAEAVLAAGLVWIGPPPDAIRALGDKTRARAIAQSVGAPLAAGSERPLESPAEVRAFAAEHGYPLVIKATHGGGGRGLRIVRSSDEVDDAFAAATREALAAFGQGACFAERYLERARHVEVQVLADGYGGVQTLGTRDCTLQRRNQKLVEEAPAPFLTPGQENLLLQTARDVCAAARYVGAGTVEFLVTADGAVSFLEVNTRLQVEHTVTEETTGVDLVREQFRIASGGRIGSTPVSTSRHAIQFRINAEDPARGFIPSTGRIDRITTPGGPGVRVDSGVADGTVLTGSYDSLLAKLTVVGSSRRQALERARRALREYSIDGVATVLPFHRVIVEDDDFSSDEPAAFLVHTRWIDETWTAKPPEAPPLGAPSDEYTVEIGGRRMTVALPGLTASTSAALRSVRQRAGEPRPNPQVVATGNVVAPMQGTVVAVAVKEAETVTVGQLIAVIEAMKMENPLRAPRAGRVVSLAVKPGDSVTSGQLICRVSAADDDRRDTG
jgi:acetyl-CoA/propionyl-CoA carboxylase, biotin carboxylase, biotin carboxyl carrier protein